MVVLQACDVVLETPESSVVPLQVGKQEAKVGRATSKSAPTQQKGLSSCSP